ncbi:hypothetical protein TNCV_1728891 [Trichonephila clavipes]|nr:hypothetical protein TNCV_1728891 [Trichonephila clavipes]
MKVSSIFSAAEDSMRITLYSISRLISEKITPPFSALQYPAFLAGCNQTDSPDWKESVKASLCKMSVA